jgi:hypothetical protein
MRARACFFVYFLFVANKYKLYGLLQLELIKYAVFLQGIYLSF